MSLSFTKLAPVKLAVGSAIGSLLSGAVIASDLVITFDDLNPAPKAAFEAAVDAFKAAKTLGRNKVTQVKVNVADEYRVYFRNK